MTKDWNVHKRVDTKKLEGTTIQLTLNVPYEIKSQLIALSYIEGLNGSYGPMGRKIIMKYIDLYMAEHLDPEEVREYQEILKNVKREVTMAHDLAQEGRSARKRIRDGDDAFFIPPG